MIKFLKKFKEKILVALACSFIGIGTILSNTLETKAYTTDRFSYTCQYVGTTGINNDYNLYTFESRPIRDTCLLINIDTSVLNNSIGNQQNNINIFGNIGNYNNGVYTNSISSFVYFNTGNSRNLNVFSYIIAFTSYGLQNYTCNCFSLNFRFNTTDGWVSLDNSYILNIDYVSINDVLVSDYMDTYTATLQTQYENLQADYTSYQNSHIYTNEQYNSLMTQNATLTQQVQSLQSQYDTYVSLHLYTNEQYETLLFNYNNLNQIYNDLQSSYISLQNQYNMLSNGQLGYLSYMEFYINNQSIEFGTDSETELNLNELIEYNLYANNSLSLSYFTTQQVNSNYLPLKIVSYYDELPVNLFSMYFNGVSSGVIKVGYYHNSQYILKQISFDNTGTAIDSINSSMINYEVFNGISVDYIEYIEIEFNNADLIAGSINFNGLYNIAYSNGYTNGYNYGYNVSDNQNRELINNARQEGYQSGYDVGKQDGIEIGSDENNSLYGVVIRTL